MIAVILAGGKGTRMGSSANQVPKTLTLVEGRPVLLHQFDQLRRADIRRCLLLTGHLGETIQEDIGNGAPWSMDVIYRRETVPLGTAGALRQARSVVQEDFLLLYGDVMFDLDLQDLIAFHRDRRAEVTIVVHPNDHPGDSDLVTTERSGRIIAIHRKNAHPAVCPNLACAAMMLVDHRVLDAIPAPATDLAGEVLPLFLQRHMRLYAYQTTEYIKDMGTPERLEQVRHDFRTGLIAARSRRNQRPAIFLDRDGTVIEYVPLLHTPEEIRLLSGAARAIQRLNRSRFLVFLVTNQPVVARNICSEEELQVLHHILETLLGAQGAYLDGISFCPHHPDGGYPEENPAYKIPCTCRKPAPDMIRQAAAEHNLDLAHSWIIGDSTRDIQTGSNMGIRSILVETGRAGSDRTFNATPTHIAAGLPEAVATILGQTI